MRMMMAMRRLIDKKKEMRMTIPRRVWIVGVLSIMRIDTMDRIILVSSDKTHVMIIEINHIR